MSSIKIFGPLRKAEEQDDGTLRIEGIASAEVVDSVGETVLAAAMKAAISGFMRPAGKGALRVMHRSDIAAGTVDDVTVDDKSGETTVVCTVVDSDTIRKVQANVLRGLSVGGRVTARDPKNSKIITGVDWRELSLVDRPACHASVLLARADTAAPLGQASITGGQMAPVHALSEAEIAELMAGMSGDDRAKFLIHAIHAFGPTRRY